MTLERQLQVRKVVWWIISTLLVITLGLSSALFGMIRGDIERIETRQQVIEERINQTNEKIGQIQQEYYRIAVIEFQVGEIRDLLKEGDR